jgi:hypothetical protein
MFNAQRRWCLQSYCLTRRTWCCKWVLINVRAHTPRIDCGVQSMDYSEFIDRYHADIVCFHVKVGTVYGGMQAPQPTCALFPLPLQDAEFRPNGRTGAYGGYLPWIERAGRFRSPGDGDVRRVLYPGGKRSRLSQCRWTSPGFSLS